MKKTLGLTEQQVLESRRRHGDNVLTPPPRKSLWKLFLEKFDDPLIKILLVALMLSVGISIYELVHLKQGAEVLLEPLGIVIAVVLATLVGFLVEVNANKKFDLLNRTNDDVLYKVMRTGHVTQVPRRDIVVGDIVILDTGERVPADGRLTQSVSMSVDESSLTGEPMARKSHQVDQAEQKGHESTYPVNMLLRGSTVSEGNGVMEVTAVGDATEYGKVFTDSRAETDVKTPLTLQLDRLGRLIARGSYVIAALIIVGRTVAFYFDDNPDGTLLYQVQYFIQTIMLAVTLVVVSVPEGLPMSVTLSLALSMRRMLKTNNLVRRMHACETMGATTVICTDKTGTLTQNQMQVVASHFETQEARSERQGAEGKDDSQLIVDVSIACNTTAYLDDSDSNRVIALGNPTEGALLLWLNEQGKDYLALREQYRIVDRMPFSTERKYMASVVKLDDVDRVLLVKGAPEIVIDMSDIDPAKRREAQATLEQYQLKAMRTLAFAYVPLDASAEGCELADMLAKLQGQMHYLGFVAISDPVREQVPLSIQDCRNAGIRVKMVTGDNAATAREIARQSGIWTDQDNESNIITGPEFAALADDDAAQVAQRVKVMARARPSDKARLVSLLQAQDEVVAVTGDGTNDAPALNLAQVGLSMGDGTAAAKEASDITILDNSFTSINKAVLWGRSLYRNIQRFILFQLTVNVCACLVVALCSFFSTQQVPLTVTQMLWVNLIMDTFAALALASLPPNSIVMRRPPRRAGEHIITPSMAWFIVLVGGVFAVAMTWLYYTLLHNQGGPMLHASFDCHEVSIYFSTFVFLQFWNLFNAKSFGSGHSAFHNAEDSRVFFAIVAVILVGQVLIVQFGGRMFDVSPLSLSEWLGIIGCTSIVMWLGELYHWVRRLRRAPVAPHA
ncbi:MAG: calcium-translocating P-type ATPase, PMCA-type [Muribaculaceae bacterium]|nr:calcium-translocating P-type ATPase, PMCA-type [Muribaculaceae bacterium]